MIPSPPKRRHAFRRRDRGFTLPELLTTVTLVAILSSMAVIGFGRITGQAKDSIAQNLVETLNQGTKNYSHANSDLKFNPIATSAGDEMLVLRSLQWRESDGVPNEKEIFYRGPYVRVDWNPATSDDVADWRIQWTGSSWSLLKPDEVGAGLKVDFDGADLGTPFVFPVNFKPVGSR